MVCGIRVRFPQTTALVSPILGSPHSLSTQHSRFHSLAQHSLTLSPLSLAVSCHRPAVSHSRPSLLASLSFSSPSVITPTTIKKRLVFLGARSTLLNASTSPHSSFKIHRLSIAILLFIPL